MINQEIILSQLSGALEDVNGHDTEHLTEDDKVRIAETIMGIQMQLDMLEGDIDPQVTAQLNALIAAAGKANIVWN